MIIYKYILPDLRDQSKVTSFTIRAQHGRLRLSQQSQPFTVLTNLNPGDKKLFKGTADLIVVFHDQDFKHPICLILPHSF